MNSSTIISLSIVGLSQAALMGCTSGGAAVSELADASVTDAPAEASSGPCTFSADAYDLSCATDTDCVAVSPSYYCSPAQCGCSAIAISRSALPEFNAAVAKTPLGSGAVQGVDCGCPVFADGMCCVNGMCQSVCPSDTLAACADAGGFCAPDEISCGSGGLGPPDSCARTNEKCCVSP
jgi:hypothetical protein